MLNSLPNPQATSTSCSEAMFLSMLFVYEMKSVSFWIKQGKNTTIFSKLYAGFYTTCIKKQQQQQETNSSLTLSLASWQPPPPLKKNRFFLRGGRGGLYTGSLSARFLSLKWRIQSRRAENTNPVPWTTPQTTLWTTLWNIFPLINQKSLPRVKKGKKCICVSWGAFDRPYFGIGIHGIQ